MSQESLVGYMIAFLFGWGFHASIDYANMRQYIMDKLHKLRRYLNGMELP